MRKYFYYFAREKRVKFMTAKVRKKRRIRKKNLWTLYDLLFCKYAFIPHDNVPNWTFVPESNVVVVNDDDDLPF